MQSIGIQANSLVDVQMPAPSILDLLRSDESLKTATGIETINLFRGILECCRRKQKDRQSDLERNLVLTLMKLKHALSFKLLAMLFSVSVATAASAFKDTITLLGIVLKSALTWPSVEEVRQNMPRCFAKFQKTRVVLDCTEVSVENSRCAKCRNQTYSHYKGTNTLKVLIGVSPGGLITHVSVPWAGRSSDKVIFEQSRIVECLEPYVDAVMVDKGFHIEQELESHGIEMYRPPFLRNKSKFSRHEAELTAEIAAARVHVERVIGRMKNFMILNSKLSWRLLPYADAIIYSVCGIINLSRPILSSDKFL